MTNGLILLVFIAAVVAFAATRVRRRMGMGNATFRSLGVIMGVVILAVLLIWVYQGSS